LNARAVILSGVKPSRVTSPANQRPERPDHRFPKSLRLRRRAEFARVFDVKCSVADRYLVLYVAPNELGLTRLGLSVGRKVGKAVIRNRIKRLLREAFRLSRRDLPVGFDLICIPRRGVDGSLAAYQASIKKLTRTGAERLTRKPR